MTDMPAQKDRNDLGRRPGSGAAVRRITGQEARRDSRSDVLKTILWVIPLTLLIWVYAEREQVRTEEIQRVPIQVRSAASDRIVTLVDADIAYVDLELRGPQASLNRIRDTFSSPRAAPVEVRIGDETDLPYEGNISLAERIGRDSLFLDEAVVVERVRPPTVRIRLERRVTAQAKVQLRPEDRGRITGEVRFEPEVVTVEAPESAIPSDETRDLAAYADLGALVDRAPGRYEAVVPVAFPGSARAVIQPRTVKATVDVKPSEQRTLSIPVLVLVNGAVLSERRYRIQCSPVTLQVTVTGPASAMAALDKALQDRSFIPAAIVEIRPQDLTGLVAPESTILKRLGPSDYRMPKDVTVTSEGQDVTLIITPAVSG